MTANEESLIEFIRDLIAIPSVNGIHGETACSQRIVDEALKLGLDAQLHGIEHDRMNVVVSTRIGNGESDEPLFLFVGHVDTVALGGGPMNELWSCPPLSATIRDNKIIGRGACDNKAGIACALYAMAKLKQSVTNTVSGRVYLAGVVDEESGANSDIGCRYLLEKGIIGGKGAIYTEPNRNITIGHRGLIRIAIDIIGESCHSGSSQWCSGKKGANAVMALAEILFKVESFAWPLDLHESFPNLRLTVTPGTIFEGGSFESAVPDKARGMIDIRTMPDTDPEFVIETIRNIINEVIDRRNQEYHKGNPLITPTTESQFPPRLSHTLQVKNNLPAAVVPGGASHPLPQACIHAVKQVVNEDCTNIGGCGPANEGYMLMNKGIPTICGFGPIGGNAHSVDEWIDKDSLLPTVNIYALIVENYLQRLN